MAYFANGTEGEFYEAAICERCIHYQLPDGYNICPVWTLHLDHNGEKGAIGEMLDELIPRHSPGHSDLCNMWHPSDPQYADHGKDYREWLKSSTPHSVST